MFYRLAILFISISIHAQEYEINSEELEELKKHSKFYDI